MKLIEMLNLITDPIMVSDRDEKVKYVEDCCEDINHFNGYSYVYVGDLLCAECSNLDERDYEKLINKEVIGIAPSFTEDGTPILVIEVGKEF